MSNILPLVSETSSRLRETAVDFDFSNPPMNPVDLANTLIENMFLHKGLGLSACQVGLPYRVFACHAETPLVLFNPFIVDMSEELIVLEEGCLSFPNIYMKIKRPKSVKVRFQDAFGETHNAKYTGMTARVVYHEYDHLNGKTFLERANLFHKEQAFNRRKKIERSLKNKEN